MPADRPSLNPLDFGAPGGLFRRLREASGADWTGYTWHPFVRQLSAGTLPLAAFLRGALQRNQRCVRVIHGMGLGSQGKTPVLTGKVRGWLVQRLEVIAFCQARAADGGSGALIVLLRPGGAALRRDGR
jgi:hypothetical protein